MNSKNKLGNKLFISSSSNSTIIPQTEAQHKTGIKIWLFHDSDTIISLVVEHD